MLSFHQVLRSALTIVPSRHARLLFPPGLQARIAVQFEGFDVTPAPGPDPDPGAPFTIGFAARDLSLAKGLEVYLRLADRVLRAGDADAEVAGRRGMRCVAIGDPTAATGAEPHISVVAPRFMALFRRAIAAGDR